MSWLLPLMVLAPLAVVAIALGARSHQVKLERMHLVTDERTLFDEDACRVHLRTPAQNRSQRFVGTVARLTNRRLILAQKYLFGRSHLVQAVFLYRGEVPEIDRREGVLKSYQNYRVDPRSVVLDEKTNPPTVRLSARPELDGPVVFPVELTLSCARAPELARALGFSDAG